MTRRYELNCPKCGGEFTSHLDSDEHLMFASVPCPYCREPVFMIGSMGRKPESVTPPTLGVSVSDGLTVGERMK